MKTTPAVVLFLILLLGSGAAARAACIGASVNSFGAKGDGVTDDTAAIQSAINTVRSSGGGSVVFSVARYLTKGTLSVPRGVVLCGAVEGPFDVSGVDPKATTIAPTILVTYTGGPFLTLDGQGAGVTDLLFHYPQQLPASAAAPTVYPFTIQMNAPSTKVARSTVTNAYNFLDIEIGRATAQDLFIGAFNIGVNIDHTEDHVTLRNLLHTVYWDLLENATYPSPMDAWVLSHGTALVVNHMDSLEVHDFFVFSRFTGILLTDSTDTTQLSLCGWGAGSDIDLKNVQYGIVISAAETPGYTFTNVDIGAAPGLGKAALQVNPGGSQPPKIEINGGSQRGTWANGAYPAPGPETIVVNILP